MMIWRRAAHRLGILWSPSCAMLGMPFGRHGARSSPVNPAHAAQVAAAQDSFNRAVTNALGRRTK